MLKTVTNTPGNHVTLGLCCAPKSPNLYASTRLTQMNIRCQESFSIPTDFAIPASQLPRTARSLESLIADYQRGIWIAMSIGQDTLVRYTMLEASRQAKNVGDIRQVVERLADSSSVPWTRRCSADRCNQPPGSQRFQHCCSSVRGFWGSAFTACKHSPSSEQFEGSNRVNPRREDEAAPRKAREEASK